MSVYVLRAFAPHLAIVEKSCLEAREPQFGALAMAVAAVGVLSYHGRLSSNSGFCRLKLPSTASSLPGHTSHLSVTSIRSVVPGFVTSG